MPPALVKQIFINKSYVPGTRRGSEVTIVKNSADMVPICIKFVTSWGEGMCEGTWVRKQAVREQCDKGYTGGS